MLKPLEIPVIFGLSIEVYFLLFFIAVPAYFFWRWFFRNRIPSPKKRLRAIWISTLVVTPFIYVGLIAILILIITREPSKSFKQTDWATNKESRFAMGDDIVSSKILINKDTSQIRHILGEPTWKDSLNKNIDSMVYE